MSEQLIRVAGIERESIVDGPGIRVVIFAQGCPHQCLGCHNPQSHAFDQGCLMGTAQLVEIVKENPLARGVTFSGGEPFCQAAAFAGLARQLRKQGYELACYTGYTWEQLTSADRQDWALLLAELDILIDGRFEQGQRNLNLRFRASENQRILDVRAGLCEGQAVWCRQTRWTGEAKLQTEHSKT